MECLNEPGASSTGGGSDGEDSCQIAVSSEKLPQPKKARFCQALGCTVELSKTGRAYCIKRGLCQEHMKADAILRQGCGDQLWRFCQQCGKLEPLSRFEGAKRSCRNGLRKRRVSNNPTNKMMFTANHSISSSSSEGCNSSKQQQQQQQQQQQAPVLETLPESVMVLENQLQALQTLLTQLEQETAAAAAELNTQMLYAAANGGSNDSSSAVVTCAWMNAASNSITPFATSADAHSHSNLQQQQQLSLNVSGSVTPAIPSASASAGHDISLGPAAAAAATPTSLEEWMQLAESDDTQFEAWIEHVLRRDYAAAAAAAAAATPNAQQQLPVSHGQLTYAPSGSDSHLAAAAAAAQQNMDLLLERELWRSCYRY